jgi:hypothetical protein
MPSVVGEGLWWLSLLWPPLPTETSVVRHGIIYLKLGKLDSTVRQQGLEASEEAIWGQRVTGHSSACAREGPPAWVHCHIWLSPVRLQLLCSWLGRCFMPICQIRKPGLTCIMHPRSRSWSEAAPVAQSRVMPCLQPQGIAGLPEGLLLGEGTVPGLSPCWHILCA